MIVSTTVVAMLLSVVAGGGSGAPQVGIVPAIAEPKRTQVNANAARDRFMFLSPIFWGSKLMQELLHLVIRPI
jgi:hypothetical protein